MYKQSDQSREPSAEEKHLKCSADEALNVGSQNPVLAEQMGQSPICGPKDNNV